MYNLFEPLVKAGYVSITDHTDQETGDSFLRITRNDAEIPIEAKVQFDLLYNLMIDGSVDFSLDDIEVRTSELIVAELESIIDAIDRGEAKEDQD